MLSAALYARVRTSCAIAHETAGAARTRLSLRPPIGGCEIPANLGRIAPRDCEAVSGWTNVIAESACDEAIHSFFMQRNGLLRYARNDGGDGAFARSRGSE